ncbi:MAG: PEP-CTERM sorting domain-containing protein [Cyanobacteria bacterium P01_D01_bin.115]
MLSFGKLIIALTDKKGGAVVLRTGSAIAVGTALSLGTLAPAQAATFRLSWTGQILGYSAEGQFSYDDAQTYENGIVRGDDLDAFDITFFDPQGNLIQEFEDNHLTYAGFNFNFDTQTGEILQDGSFNEPNGIDIGEYTVLFDDAGEPIGATGLNFWSAAPLTDDGETIPHVHLTDFGDEFPDLPIGFGSHLDVAFFTRTQAQLLDDPSAGDQLGQRMVATKVPEPGALVGLGAIALLALRLRRKSGAIDLI